MWRGIGSVETDLAGQLLLGPVFERDVSGFFYRAGHLQYVRPISFKLGWKRNVSLHYPSRRLSGKQVVWHDRWSHLTVKNAASDTMYGCITVIGHRIETESSHFPRFTIVKVNHLKGHARVQKIYLFTMMMTLQQGQ